MIGSLCARPVNSGVRQLSLTKGGNMFSYTEAKQFLVESLTRDANAHESGRYQDVGRDFDEFDTNLPRGSGPEFNKLLIALNFWDGWIDARNHDWQYYEGINESGWPLLASRVIESLVKDEEISEPVVLKHFDFRAQQSGEGRIKSWLARLREM